MYKAGNSVEQVFGGNVIKQGDGTPLGFNFRSENGELVNLNGATVEVKIASEKGVVVEKQAVISDQYTVTFSLSQEDITGSGDMRIEFIVTYSGGTVEKFPSDDWQRIRITPTLEDVEKYGVGYITFEKLTEELTEEFQSQFQSFKDAVTEQTEIQVQRVENLINSNPQPSEIVDMRTDAEGVVYTTAGERLNAEQQMVGSVSEVSWLPEKITQALNDLKSWYDQQAINIKTPPYNAKTNGVDDDSPAIVKALQDANSKGIGLIKLFGTVTIGSKISISGNVGFMGNNVSKTNIQPKAGYTGTLFEAKGQYRSEGSTVVANIWFENLTFNGLEVADKALYIKGGYKILLSKCRFLKFTGEFVYYDQVYDSWVDKCVFDYSAGTDLTKPLFMLNYGSGDNTNEIHFNGCRWETFNRPAVKLNSGPNGYETVNEIKFTSCKWESIYKTDFIVLNGCANVNFVLCNFAIPIGSSSDTPYYGIRAIKSNSVHFVASEVEWFVSGGDTSFPFLYADSKSSNISFQGNLGAFVYNTRFPIEVESGFLGLNLYGAYENGYPANKVTNAADSVINMVPMLNAVGENPTVNVTYQKDSKYYKWAIRPQSDGSLNIERNGILYAKYNADTKLFVPSGGAYFSGGWSSGSLLRIGGYYLWVDSKNNLRMKINPPTSDTDGIVIASNTPFAWYDATLLNGFTHYDAATHVEYAKDAQNNVFIRGASSGGSVARTVFNLPVGLRPSRDQYFVTINDPTGMYMANIKIDSSNGNVILMVASSPNPTSFVRYDITFKVEG
ncbi:hypothetical protein ABEY55_20145 [Priestia aryabhattai]|uniref:hypothetical protein n=1 Tax=Priestia aryabhattai TaxID=412384 RepID=UPI003D2C6FDE